MLDLDAERPAEVSSWLRVHRLSLLVVGAAILCAYAYTFVYPFPLLADNQAYFLLAKSLLGGSGYVDAWSPAAPPANHYPPGYPVLLAGWMGIAGQSVLAAKLLSGLFLAAALVLTYALTRLVTADERIALVTVVFVGLNATMLQFGSLVMSEMAFTAVSLFALYALARSERAASAPVQWAWVVTAAVAVSAAYYVRSAGLALAVGLAAGLLVRGRWWRAGALLALFVAAAYPWYVRGQQLGGASYVQALRRRSWQLHDAGDATAQEFGGRVVTNAWGYLSRAAPEALWPGAQLWTAGWTPAVVATMFGATALSAVGWSRLAYLRWELAGYLAATAGILLLWPSDWVYARFVLPLVPLLTLLAVAGAWAVLARLSAGPAPSPYLLLPLALFSLMSLPAARAWAEEPEGYIGRDTNEMMRLMDVLIPDDAIVAARHTAQVYAFTGNRSVKLEAYMDPEKVLASLDRSAPDYILLDEGHQAVYWRYVAPVIDAHPERFERVLRVQGPRYYTAYGRPLAAELYRFYARPQERAQSREEVSE